MPQIPPNAYWRDSARNPRFFFIDYRATFPLLALLFHPSWLTLGFALIAVAFFAGIEYYGFTVPVFLRWFRGVLGGNRKEANPWWMRRQ